MRLFDKVIGRYANTAGKAMSAGVKQEIKAGVIKALPGIIGIGTLVLGILACRASGSTSGMSKAAIRTVTITTNNYFLDATMKEDVITRMIK